MALAGGCRSAGFAADVTVELEPGLATPAEVELLVEHLAGGSTLGTDLQTRTGADLFADPGSSNVIHVEPPDGADAIRVAGTARDAAGEVIAAGEVTVARTAGTAAATLTLLAIAPAECGDGLRAGDEVCDGADLGGQDCALLGFDGGALGCTTACALDLAGCSTCGNGVRESGEDCDGADLGGSDCALEGFDGGTLGCTAPGPAGCTHDPAGCTTCGDGTRAGLEECDGADLGGNDCTTIGQGWAGGALGCAADCAFDATACTPAPACGDGTVGPGEECEPGPPADLAGASCASLGFSGGALGCFGGCLFDTSGCFSCGDGVAEGPEDCDGADLGGNDCTTLGGGFDGGALGCTPACTYDTAGCATCGNLAREAGEACDGADLGGAACSTVGPYDGGMLACDPACTLVIAGCTLCGDGARAGSEACDGADLGGQSCTTIGLGFDGGTLACTPGCTYETAGCTIPPLCGNGAVDAAAGEACDGAELGGASCATLGWSAGALACTVACAFDASGCHACGNGSIEGPELCDGTSSGGATCLSLGHDAGILACAPGCLALDETGCSDCGDGTVEPPEACDGAVSAGDTCATVAGLASGTLACSAACSYVTSGCYECGNLILEGAETCDGSDLDGATCVSLGHLGGSLSCAPGCLSYNTTSCTDCGDGAIDPGESCDGASLGGATCVSLGYGGGTLGCTAGCTFDPGACTPPVPCGDGVIGGSEECDPPAMGAGTCSSETGGALPAGTLACDAACQYDTSGCSFCGDGTAGGAEDCDGADLDGQACATATGGLLPNGALACTSGCTFDTTGCHDCGDALVQGPELCDGTDLGGATCTSEGPGVYSGGPLACSAACNAFVTTGCHPPPAVPALRKPLNDTYTGSPGTMAAPLSANLRPAFTWDASSIPGCSAACPAVTYDLQYGTDPTFAVTTSVASLPGTSYTPAADLAISWSAPVGARYYWRVRACAGGACSAYPTAWWVNVGRGAGSGAHDYNGDGYADVVVGAYVNDAGGSSAGRAYVYFGGPGGTLDPTPDGTLTGAAAGDLFGYRVAPAGDVNGDGYADVVVGAIGNDAGGADAGRAYVYFGGPGATFDATADGVLTGAAAGDELGFAVAPAGDVNGDGYADVVVGAHNNDAGGANAGRAYVYLGGPGATFDATADGTLSGAAAADELGNAVSSAGDVNADGYADVVVGAFRNDAGGIDAGRAYLYFGGPGVTFDATADVSLTALAAANFFGYSVASAGDVDGDGYSDVIVGAIFNDAGGTDAGAAYLYRGGATFEATADVTLIGAAANDQFGGAVAAAGDVNGDGFADFIVGARFNDAGATNTGRAYVYLGGLGAALDATPDGVLTGAASMDEFGASAAPAGDVDGDGFADVIVGAYLNDAGGTNAGRAYLFRGGPGASFDASPDGTLTGAAPFDLFGHSVASAGRPTAPPPMEVALPPTRRRVRRAARVLRRASSAGGWAARSSEVRTSASSRRRR